MNKIAIYCFWHKGKTLDFQSKSRINLQILKQWCQNDQFDESKALNDVDINFPIFSYQTNSNIVKLKCEINVMISKKPNENCIQSKRVEPFAIACILKIQWGYFTDESLQSISSRLPKKQTFFNSILKSRFNGEFLESSFT